MGWVTAGLALAVFAVDQITKFLARTNLGPDGGLGQVDVLGNWLRFTYVTNTGAAFGIFPDRTVLFTAVAIVAIPVLLFFQRALPKRAWPVQLSLGLLLGGTFGNLVDRLVFGYVVDFVDVGIGHLRWPTFNVADSAFVIGILILSAYLLFSGDSLQAKDAG